MRGQRLAEPGQQLRHPGLGPVLEGDGHGLVDDERIGTGHGVEVPSHGNPVIDLVLAGVAVTAPDQQRLGQGSRGQLAQVGRLLTFPPVGELRGQELRRVGIRRHLEHGLISPQAPAQLQRRRDQPPHVRLSQFLH